MHRGKHTEAFGRILKIMSALAESAKCSQQRANRGHFAHTFNGHKLQV